MSSTSIDVDRDGTVDQIETYSYDSDGRMVMREVQNSQTPSRSKIVTYQYDNGVLVRKFSDDGAEDVHTISNGNPVSSTRNWDGEHTYAYNANGQLIESTGDDFSYLNFCDDSDFDEESEPSVATFRYSYNGDAIASVVTDDGNFSLEFSYENGRVSNIDERIDCGDGFVTDSRFIYTYDDNNRLAQFETFEVDSDVGFISNIETLELFRDDQGRITQSVSTASNGEVTTIDRVYGTNNLPLSDDLVVTNRRSMFFVTPDQAITYTYEEGPCVVSYTSNPSDLAVLETFAASLAEPSPLNCGYALDRNEF